MPPEFVSLEYPPGSACSSRVLCKPVGKRRYAAWLGDEFLGHAIARVDGMWTSKTPHDETFPGRIDREAALLSLLVLHRPVGDSGFESLATRPSWSPSARQVA
jgi:hypothetical protein